ncbi:MAG: DKNYY domain-containing protein [Marinicellaceae bacterium]
MLFITNMLNKLTVIFFLVLLVSCTHDDGYRIEGNKVVYENPWNTGFGTTITNLDADAKTFQVLGDNKLDWAKDKDKVFWGTKELDYMDPASFEIFTTSMAKDKDKVICGRDIMKEANPREFKIRTFLDKNGDESIYGVDKHGAFICSEYPDGYFYLPSNSINSFQQLEDYFFKDHENVWWGNRVLPDVNVSTFKVISGGYATDGNNIYYHKKVVQGADVETFDVIGSRYAQDKNYRYEMEDRVGRVQ